MIQDDKQLEITKGKIEELKDELAIAIVRKSNGDRNAGMYIASLEVMLKRMHKEVNDYTQNSSAPTKDEGDE